MSDQLTKLPFIEESAEWICLREQCPDSKRVECLARISDELTTLTKRYFEQITGRAWDSRAPTAAACLKRLWRCVEVHWQRSGSGQGMLFADVLNHLQSSDADNSASGNTVLRDVVLAQLLEMKDSKAASLFEKQYMPLVRVVANRAGGRTALDSVENFSADLILPRGDRPPKIATYQGRTLLKSWLRTVVVNFCVSGFRRMGESTTESLPEPVVTPRMEMSTDKGHCEGMLRPVFSQTVSGLKNEDRMLISMLVLDEVPQKELARTLGINSGNVTRRRQKIIATIWNRMNELAEERKSERSFAECLELVLAGESRELRDALASLLAVEFRGGVADNSMEVGQ